MNKFIITHFFYGQCIDIQNTPNIEKPCFETNKKEKKENFFKDIFLKTEQILKKIRLKEKVILLNTVCSITNIDLKEKKVIVSENFFYKIQKPFVYLLFFIIFSVLVYIFFHLFKNQKNATNQVDKSLEQGQNQTHIDNKADGDKLRDQNRTEELHSEPFPLQNTAINENGHPQSDTYSEKKTTEENILEENKNQNDQATGTKREAQIMERRTEGSHSETSPFQNTEINESGSLQSDTCSEKKTTEDKILKKSQKENSQHHVNEEGVSGGTKQITPKTILEEINNQNHPHKQLECEPQKTRSRAYPLESESFPFQNTEINESAQEDINEDDMFLPNNCTFFLGKKEDDTFVLFEKKDDKYYLKLSQWLDFLFQSEDFKKLLLYHFVFYDLFLKRGRSKIEGINYQLMSIDYKKINKIVKKHCLFLEHHAILFYFCGKFEEVSSANFNQKKFEISNISEIITSKDDFVQMNFFYFFEYIKEIWINDIHQNYETDTTLMIISFIKIFPETEEIKRNIKLSIGNSIRNLTFFNKGVSKSVSLGKSNIINVLFSFPFFEKLYKEKFKNETILINNTNNNHLKINYYEIEKQAQNRWFFLNTCVILPLDGVFQDIFYSALYHATDINLDINKLIRSSDDFYKMIFFYQKQIEQEIKSQENELKKSKDETELFIKVTKLFPTTAEIKNSIKYFFNLNSCISISFEYKTRREVYHSSLTYFIRSFFSIFKKITGASFNIKFDTFFPEQIITDQQKETFFPVSFNYIASFQEKIKDSFFLYKIGDEIIYYNAFEYLRYQSFLEKFHLKQEDNNLFYYFLQKEQENKIKKFFQVNPPIYDTTLHQLKIIMYQCLLTQKEIDSAKIETKEIQKAKKIIMEKTYSIIFKE